MSKERKNTLGLFLAICIENMTMDPASRLDIGQGHYSREKSAVYLVVVLQGRLDGDHGADVAQLKLGKEAIKEAEVLAELVAEVHRVAEALLPEQLPHRFERLGQGFGQRPHHGALRFSVQDARTSRQTLQIS